MAEVEFHPRLGNKYAREYIGRAEFVIDETSDQIEEMMCLINDLEKDEDIPEDEKISLLELIVVGFLKVLAVKIGSGERSQKKLERALFEAFTNEEENIAYA